MPHTLQAGPEKFKNKAKAYRKCRQSGASSDVDLLAVMPHLHDDPQFQEYHPGSDGLANHELPTDPLNMLYEPHLHDRKEALTR